MSWVSLFTHVVSNLHMWAEDIHSNGRLTPEVFFFLQHLPSCQRVILRQCSLIIVGRGAHSSAIHIPFMKFISRCLHSSSGKMFSSAFVMHKITSEHSLKSCRHTLLPSVVNVVSHLIRWLSPDRLTSFCELDQRLARRCPCVRLVGLVTGGWWLVI